MISSGRCPGEVFKFLNILAGSKELPWSRRVADPPKKNFPEGQQLGASTRLERD